MNGPGRMRRRIFLLLCLVSGLAAPTRAQAVQVDVPTEELRLGQLDGPPAHTFGEVKDVRPIDAGRFVVLDAHAPVVKLYDMSGRLLAATGRDGQGPGEFRWPAAAAVAGDRLYIVDTGNRRIQEFRVADDEMAFVRVFRLPFDARDVCAVGKRVYVSGLHEGHTVHEVSVDGEIVRSFGELSKADEVPEGWPRRILQETRSVGFLACSTARRTIVSLGVHGPEIRAYSPDGAERWTAVLRDYSRMGAAMTDRGTMQYRGDPKTGVHHKAVALAVDDRRVFAQLTHIGDAVSRDDAPIETRILSLATGEEEGAVDGLPRLSAVAGTYYYGYLHLPYPQVLVLAAKR